MAYPYTESELPSATQDWRAIAPALAYAEEICRSHGWLSAAPYVEARFHRLAYGDRQHTKQSLAECRLLNKAVRCLLNSRTTLELEEQLRALFGMGEKNWNKALTEFTGLYGLHCLGVLADIGYPVRKTMTPEFDGSLVVPGERDKVAFDIKAANDTGFNLLLGVLQDRTQRWAIRAKVRRPVVQMSVEGGLAKRSVELAIRAGLLRQFDTFLIASTSYPTRTFAFQTSELSLVVQVAPLERGYVYTSEAHLYPDETELSAAKMVVEHANHKAVHAAKLGCRFVLVYCEPSGIGNGDLTAKNLSQVVGLAAELLGAQTPEWLGCVYLGGAGAVEFCSAAAPRPGAALGDSATRTLALLNDFRPR